MTISTTTIKSSYTGNGSTVAFTYNFKITAETESGIIMGIEHNEFNVHGVQFHPESIKTTIGIKILRNFINYKK